MSLPFENGAHRGSPNLPAAKTIAGRSRLAMSEAGSGCIEGIPSAKKFVKIMQCAKITVVVVEAPAQIIQKEHPRSLIFDILCGMYLN